MQTGVSESDLKLKPIPLRESVQIFDDSGPYRRYVARVNSTRTEPVIIRRGNKH
jgi:hypothetical protein